MTNSDEIIDTIKPQKVQLIPTEGFCWIPEGKRSTVSHPTRIESDKNPPDYCGSVDTERWSTADIISSSMKATVMCVQRLRVLGGYCILQEEQHGSSLSGWAA